MSIFRFALSLVSPGGKRGRLSIFIFHRVLPEVDPLSPDEPDAHRFDEMMGWVASWFNVLALDEAIDRLAQQSLPDRAAAITFDDGYADNYSIALPILKKHGLSATFFITTGFLNGGRMWNDTIIESIRTCPLPSLDLSSLGLGMHSLTSLQEKRTAIHALIRQIKYQSLDQRIAVTEEIATLSQASLPTGLMMTTHEVVQLRQAGMQIGAHTVSHPILAKTNLSEARREIQDSKAYLEHALGERIRLFAFPNGKPDVDYLSEHVALVRDLGFDAAVSTASGSACVKNADFHQLPRFSPWDKTKTRFGLRLLQNLLRSPVQE